MNTTRPEILAPAGDRDSFLAALAGGADAIYVGLKHFSARMQADNFSVADLAALTELAHEDGCKVYVAMNTLVKPGDVESAGRLCDRINKNVNPDALIIQDPAMIRLAREAGYTGELHLSTLANITHPRQFATIARDLDVARIVLPRELNIDEIKECNDACPDGLKLETFIHGALCYNVSGRCYWSSYLGGKSGLRGRCVQPCRREYESKNKKARYFSCNDLSLDVLVKALAPLENVTSWKIEGRRKGPHYVYYTTSAYRLLRDNPGDAQARKTATSLLEQALGRPGTHYAFLPQRAGTPVDTSMQSGSGQLIAKAAGIKNRKMSINPRQPLIPGDRLRVGYQDDRWYQTFRVNKSVPKGGRLDVKLKGKSPKPGTPIFLIDRREPELERELEKRRQRLAKIKHPKADASEFVPELPRKYRPKTKGKQKVTVMNVNRRAPKTAQKGTAPGLWLAPKTPLRGASRTWWWLPPVIWPNEEKLWGETISRALNAGARSFVLGAPWQKCFFENYKPKPRTRDVELWAGPFCNIGNPMFLQVLKDMGFAGAFASIELAKDDALALPENSPLPLGFVTYGNWPLGITRVRQGEVKQGRPMKSPKGEICWTRPYGQNTWIYPGWGVDLREHMKKLVGAGYTMFAHIFEPKPKEVPRATRVSTFNWDLNLM